jgi:16S rRNA processing protein RimM
MNEGGDTRVSVGYVRRAHGVRGDVIVRPLTDNPDRYAVGAVLITDESPSLPLVVAEARPHNDGLLVHFEGIEDRTTAEALQGTTLTISRDERRVLGAEEYWPDDLEGLAAITPDGTRVGTVSGVVLGEAQDRLVITTEAGHEFEVPFVEPIIAEIHPSLGHVIVDAPTGLTPVD